MTRPVLVLGSSSPARLTTLQRAGVDPVVIVSGVDEDAELARARSLYGELEPADAPLVLAKAKAEAVARLLEAGDSGEDTTSADAGPAPSVDPGLTLVLGCDSMLELGDEVDSKPVDADDAIRRWKRMRGGTGTLHTGHWLIDLRDEEHGGTGATLGATASTVVHFADVSDEEIEAYVATGEPLQVAGAFTTDGLGGAFVRGIEGDHHTVVGVSLPLLRTLLSDCGVRWTGLWTPAAS
ncbi:MAG TPA: nucleoside triphosphate pyrophosphatase [Actinomycetales bacterium]|nr:nucleoside triphosphate pyrophosphatase [Actinomycetales bacterium]